MTVEVVVIASDDNDEGDPDKSEDILHLTVSTKSLCNNKMVIGIKKSNGITCVCKYRFPLKNYTDY